MSSTAVPPLCGCPGRHHPRSIAGLPVARHDAADVGAGAQETVDALALERAVTDGVLAALAGSWQWLRHSVVDAMTTFAAVGQWVWNVFPDHR